MQIFLSSYKKSHRIILTSPENILLYPFFIDIGTFPLEQSNQQDYFDTLFVRGALVPVGKCHVLDFNRSFRVQRKVMQCRKT